VSWCDLAVHVELTFMLGFLILICIFLGGLMYVN
jgi:hypothetical protein